jgi:soluble lytic murein transglycosylase-like protein
MMARRCLALPLSMVLALLCGRAEACWQDAADRFGVNASVLYAIARTESKLDPRARSPVNANGSYDIGLMQINSSWLPLLRRHGIDEQQLYDACTSIHVGAWILAQGMRRLGNSWDAVGAYNAVSPAKRLAYARKVYRNLPRD